MKSLILSTYEKSPEEAGKEERNIANQQIFSELKERGEAVFGQYSDLEFYISSKQIMGEVLGRKLDEFDLFLPRSATYMKYHLNYSHVTQVLAKMTLGWGKRVLNGEHFIKFSHDFNKLFQMLYFAERHYPIPETYFLSKNLSQETEVIVKPIVGSKGQGVQKLISSEATGIDEFKIVQKALHNKYNFRVVVLGDKCLGAVKRAAAPNSVVSNFSAGGSIEQVELTKEMEELSLSVAKDLSLEFCGVDLMDNDDDELRILEVNRFPDFRGFEAATHAQVAHQLVNYLEKTINQ